MNDEVLSQAVSILNTINEDSKYQVSEVGLNSSGDFGTTNDGKNIRRVTIDVEYTESYALNGGNLDLGHK